MTDYSELKELVYKFAPLGIRKVEQTGATLIGPAPFIASNAWLNHLFSPLSKQEIKELEVSLDKRIPNDYIDFLISFSNGLEVLNTTLSLEGLRYNYNRNSINDVWQPFDLIVSNVYEKPVNAASEMFFFGSYHWDGSLLYFNSQNEICYCSREDARPLKKWNNFLSMLISEIRRLYALFDDTGRSLDSSIPTIPVVSQ